MEANGTITIHLDVVADDRIDERWSWEGGPTALITFELLKYSVIYDPKFGRAPKFMPWKKIKLNRYPVLCLSHAPAMDGYYVTRLDTFRGRIEALRWRIEAVYWEIKWMIIGSLFIIGLATAAEGEMHGWHNVHGLRRIIQWFNKRRKINEIQGVMHEPKRNTEPAFIIKEDKERGKIRFDREKL